MANVKKAARKAAPKKAAVKQPTRGRKKVMRHWKMPDAPTLSPILNPVVNRTGITFQGKSLDDLSIGEMEQFFNELHLNERSFAYKNGTLVTNDPDVRQELKMPYNVVAEPGRKAMPKLTSVISDVTVVLQENEKKINEIGTLMVNCMNRMGIPVDEKIREASSVPQNENMSLYYQIENCDMLAHRHLDLLDILLHHLITISNGL